MNDRYQEEHRGVTRKSAASAKPKSKAAASVVIKSDKKSPQERKAARKAERKRAQQRQRELDAKYYKPDTPRYKKLRIAWVVCIALGVVALIVSFGFRDVLPMEAGVAVMIAAYVFIIAAFYIDFSPIKKERAAYQERMMALEEKQKKEERAARAAERAAQHQRNPRKKGSGKNASRNPKTQAKAAAENAAKKAEAEGAELAEADAPAAEAAEEKPAKKGLFGRKK